MKINYKDPSLILLVLANIITILLALWENWNILTLMWIYWLQSVVIGFFNVLKLLTVEVRSGAGSKIAGIYPSIKIPEKLSLVQKILIAGFFCLHYGLFHFGYAEFLAGGFVLGQGKGLDVSGIVIVGFVFFLNHLFSYCYNFIIRKERETGPDGLMRLFWYPYARIIPIH
ncbi:MAG: DUF6498-containing protein, partial [Candidatus Micrarchaeota archaeon]